jgi:sugar phosphate isomerase/epimerase
MTAFSRREFGRLVAAGVPFVAVAGSRNIAALSPVALGVSTFSFRDLPRVQGSDNVDDVIRALKAVRATHVELALSNVEPAPPSTASFVGGTPAYPRRIVFTPDEVARINAFARRELRQWRGQTEPRYFHDVGGKFTAANLTVVACALFYDESFTDDEIEATFRQAKALGVSTISSPMTMATARRIVPFAERHGVTVAIHNQVDGNAAGAIATRELTDALALSSSFRIKLDIGHLTASNHDAVAELARHESRVSHVLVRDRRRNGGTSQHFGEGDTPIPAVLTQLKASEFRIPGVVEYDYVGLHSSVDEVTASLAYVANASK